MADQVTRSADDLKSFCARALCRAGVGEADAAITVDVLVAADCRGVASHGVAHLRRYVDGLRNGAIAPRPRERVVVETPATAALDAGAGLGPPVSCRAMRMAIAKAAAVGAGFVTVRNSNHFRHRRLLRHAGAGG
jgi:L-2-hydroxycarboxylate dehydrogenase (NAD+)